MSASRYVHNISVVIPVYQGELTLRDLLAELGPMTEGFTTSGGHSAIVGEVILVHDRGPDRSDDVIRALADEYRFVKAVWLSRNFGQHAATLAGIASSGGGWVATMDEDGQHDPVFIGSMLDAALESNSTVIYARADNPPPHGFIRNSASKLAKRVLDSTFGGGKATDFNSFRLILGDIARSVAAYAGTSVYLDVALTWVADRVSTSTVHLRREGDRRSGYSFPRLFAHFWRMVLTSGTRGLRLVTTAGAVFAALGLVYAVYLTVARFVSGDVPEGWTSQMVLTAVGIGLVLMALGIVAEYVGVAVNMAMGKPPYLIVRDFDSGPLGHRDRDRA